MYFLLINTAFTHPAANHFAQMLAIEMNKELLLNEQKEYAELDAEQFADNLKEQDIDLIFIACKNSKRTIQQWLNRCRSLRIPYIFITDEMSLENQIKTILLPVSMLQEEVYKAQTAAHVARFTRAEVQLLIAHDYGSKAQENANKMTTLFEKMEVQSVSQIGRKNSFSINKEIVSQDFVASNKYQLSVLTASREYGLDDIMFGPQERHTICHSKVPVMLLNPREDLFSLCD